MYSKFPAADVVLMLAGITTSIILVDILRVVLE